jgi:hypothetical protein
MICIREAVKTCALGVLSVLAGPAPVHAQEIPPENDARRTSAQWTFEAGVYTWLAATDGTVGVRGVDAPVDNSFLDTLKQSDSVLGFMGHAEAHRNEFGAILDIAYTRLGFDAIPAGSTSADVTSDLLIVDAVGSYRFGRWSLSEASDGRTWSLEGLAGLRYIFMDAKFDFQGSSANLSQSTGWVDPIVGFRVSATLSESWDASLRGDIGGFGAGSDFAWQVAALATYRFGLFGTPARAAFGYRALSEDFSSSGPQRFRWDTTMHGPVLGLVFNF